MFVVARRTLPWRVEKGCAVSEAIHCTCGHTHHDVAALHMVGWQPTGDGAFGLLVNCSRCGSTILAGLVSEGAQGDGGKRSEAEALAVGFCL